MKIEQLIERIKASQKLNEEQKARLIRLCERIKAVFAAIRKALSSIREWARTHRAFINVMLVALVVAIILNQIPLVGQVLATVALLVGAVVGILKQFQSSLDEMLGLA